MIHFFNPTVFNKVILALYALNAAWWAYNGSWKDASYWLGAFWITATVTFGYGH